MAKKSKKIKRPGIPSKSFNFWGFGVCSLEMEQSVLYVQPELKGNLQNKMLLSSLKSIKHDISVLLFLKQKYYKLSSAISKQTRGALGSHTVVNLFTQQAILFFKI
jgi:hypothetical protein